MINQSGDPTGLPILVVDDCGVERRLVGAIIERECGCRVIYAEDGREALAQLAREPAAAVVTDLNMPGFGGLELVERTRELFPSVPVVLTTAIGNEEVALQALRAGAASYVPKRNLARDLGEILGQVLIAARHEQRKLQLQGSMIRRESAYELENDPALVPILVSSFQDELAGTRLCGPGERIRVGVALEEALLNSIYHGNLEVSSELKLISDASFEELAMRRRKEPPYRDRRLHVTSSVTRSEATYVIRDEGNGFDTSNLPDPTDPAHLDRPSGRGILLIRTFMDETRYNAKGNELTMIKWRKD